ARRRAREGHSAVLARHGLNDAAREAKLWGHSSAGRAPDLHSGGRRFDPVWLHHLRLAGGVPSLALHCVSMKTVRPLDLLEGSIGPIFNIVERRIDRKSTRLNSSHVKISYAVFCL